MNKFHVFACAAAFAIFASCTQDGDGPLDISSEKLDHEGKGFFEEAYIDSGSILHLASDTLLLSFRNIWSFSDCAFSSIDLSYSFEDTLLVFRPKVYYHATDEDCPSSMYRPDTTVKILLDGKIAAGFSEVRVLNENDSLMDSILVRKGTFERDTFRIFLDSSFGAGNLLPLRTKDSPSVLRLLDSMTVHSYYWRTMKEECLSRVDMCDSVVNDTLFPSMWYIEDTTLVRVRPTCADTNEVYCLSTKWKDDSTHLGTLQERLDTVWNTTSFYVEEIPEYGGFNSFVWGSLTLGAYAPFARELFVPESDEKRWVPASRKDLVIYNLSVGQMVSDTALVDSLYEIWKNADVAPDTLIVDTLEKK